MIYRTKAKQVLILEDDVKFNEKMMKENWKEIINELAQVNFDIAFIGIYIEKKKKRIHSSSSTIRNLF